MLGIHGIKYVFLMLHCLGNDYGVCCPASLKIQKTGTCPIHNEKLLDCGVMCTHDLECPSIQKCCETKQCGLSCVHPKNVTGIEYYEL